MREDSRKRSEKNNDHLRPYRSYNEQRGRNDDNRDRHLVIRNRRRSSDSIQSRDPSPRHKRKPIPRKYEDRLDMSHESDKQPPMQKKENGSLNSKRSKNSRSRSDHSPPQRYKRETFEKDRRRRSPSRSSKSSKRRSSSSNSLPSHLRSDSSNDHKNGRNRNQNRHKKEYRDKYFKNVKTIEDPLQRYRTRFAPVHHGKLIR